MGIFEQRNGMMSVLIGSLAAGQKAVEMKRGHP